MEDVYNPAISLVQRHGLEHYNLGIVERETDDLSTVQANLVKRLVGSTPIGQDTRFVDVGAGIGGAVYQIAREHEPRLALGLEISWPNVSFARASNHGCQAAGGVSFIQGDAHCLPLQNGSLDVVLSLESAFHYPDKNAFLRECRRVLKPCGHLLIGDLVADRALPGLFSRPWRAFFWSEGQYRRAMAELGFTRLRTEDVTPLVVKSIRRCLPEIRRVGIRRWWPNRRHIIGGWGTGFLLHRRRLRYLLIRAQNGPEYAAPEADPAPSATP